MISYFNIVLLIFVIFFTTIATGLVVSAQYVPKHKNRNGFTYTTVKDVMDEEEYDNRHSSCSCCYRMSQYLLH